MMSPPSRMGSPATVNSNSPSRKPAFSAGLPGSTASTRNPSVSGIRSRSFKTGSTNCPWTPNQGRITRPSSINFGTTSLIRFAGIAKPMPRASGMIAVVIPMMLPQRSTSGPPELPALIAASVCNSGSVSDHAAPGSTRLTADTTACDCLVQSERVPDGVCFVTDPHAIRITELSRWESALFGSGDPDQRQVENRVCAHWRRRQCGTVIQDHRNCSAPEDHVGIGQNEAGRVDDHARSHDALDPVFSVVRVDRGRPNQDHHRGNSLIQCWKRFLAGVNPG